MELSEETRILLVEDDTSVQKALMRCFSADGFRNIRGVDSEVGVRQALEEGEFDCVISDYNLGDTTGIKLLMDFRDDVRYQHLPFILISSQMDETLERRAREHGADACLRKDVMYDELLSAIEKVLSTRKTQ